MIIVPPTQTSGQRPLDEGQDARRLRGREGGGRVRLPQSVLLVPPRFPCPIVGDVDDIVVRGVGVYDGTSFVTGAVAPRPERAATPDRTYPHRLLLRSMSATWGNQ